jgi:hypothetical protein
MTTPAIRPDGAIDMKPAGSPPRIRPRYRREIVAVLGLKAIGLALLYYLFFAPADRPAITQQVVAHHLLAMPVSGTGDEVNHDR